MAKMIEDDFDESEMFGEGALAPVIASSNPLTQYFRVPGLSIKIPTSGRFLPKGSVSLDLKGQLDVYPMRSADELLLKSPDALMSGLALERLIESCVPGIKTPRLISMPDLDVLLLAIRAATYGNTMSIEATCPACEKDNSFDCDLPGVLATMTEVPDDLDLRLSNDVVVSFKPHSLMSQTKLLDAAYAEQRAAQAIDDNIDGEEKQTILRETLDRINSYHSDSMADAIVKIAIPNAEVTNKKHIIEFLDNTNKDWSNKIRDHVEKINMMGIDRTVAAKCVSCEHEWTARLEFDPSTFFDTSS